MSQVVEGRGGHYARLIGFAIGYVLCQRLWWPFEEGWQDDALRLGVGMAVAIGFNRIWRVWDNGRQSKKKQEL